MLNPITEKQKDFIEGICEQLEITVPRIEDKETARQWISDHIDAYHQSCLDDAYREYCSYDGEYADIYIGF